MKKNTYWNSGYCDIKIITMSHGLEHISLNYTATLIILVFLFICLGLSLIVCLLAVQVWNILYIYLYDICLSHKSYNFSFLSLMRSSLSESGVYIFYQPAPTLLFMHGKFYPPQLSHLKNRLNMTNYLPFTLLYIVYRSIIIQYFRNHFFFRFIIKYIMSFFPCWADLLTSTGYEPGLETINHANPLRNLPVSKHTLLTIINNPPMSTTPRDTNLTACFIWECYGSIILTFFAASASIFNHSIWPDCCSSSASACCQSFGREG